MAQRRGVEVAPDRVVIVPGGKVTMFMAIAMFGEPGAEIMYPDPGFPIYRSLIEWTGRHAGADRAAREPGLRVLGRGGAGADHAAHAAADRQQPGQSDRRRRAHRPSSTGWSRAWQRHPQVVVMSDEIYARMCYDGVPHASLTAYPGDRGPADPARRLVQDLRHDRLAARLGGLAGESGRASRPGSRSTSIPASTPRPSGPASPR